MIYSPYGNPIKLIAQGPKCLGGPYKVVARRIEDGAIIKYYTHQLRADGGMAEIADVVSKLPAKPPKS